MSAVSRILFPSWVLTSDLKSPSDHNCCPSNSLPLILIDGAEWWVPGSMRIWMVVNDIKRHLCEGFINGFLAALMDAQHQPLPTTHPDTSMGWWNIGYASNPVDTKSQSPLCQRYLHDKRHGLKDKPPLNSSTRPTITITPTTVSLPHLSTL